MMRRKPEDLTGQKFGRLTVIKQSASQNNRVTWLCECECGNVCTARGYKLKDGSKSSCGCLKRELDAEYINRRRQYERL